MNYCDPVEVQTSAERQGVVSVLACLLCFVFLLAFAPPVVAWLNVWWAGWLVYVGIPLTLTFTLLHGSRIHREMSEIRRDTFLFLESLAMLVSVIVFMLMVVVMVSAFSGPERIGP